MRPAILLLTTAAAVSLVVLLFGCPTGKRLTTAASGLCEERRTNEDYREAIEQGRHTAHELRESFGSPGLAIAVSMGGEVVWSEGFGYADVTLNAAARYVRAAKGFSSALGP